MADTYAGRPQALTRLFGPSFWGVATGQACLLGVAVGGDLLYVPGASSGLLKYLPQLVDNATHALIAALVWYTAISPDARYFL